MCIVPLKAYENSILHCFIHFLYHRKMRGWITYIFIIFLTTIFLCVAAWYMDPPLKVQDKILELPVPTVFALPINNQVATLDTWALPHLITDTKDTKAPYISATNALIYDMTTHTILFAKAVDEKRPFASLTKIMTAIVALEHPKTDDMYLVRQQSLVGGDSMGLSAGESLSLEELLYGLILHSGNDAAETLADNFPGGRIAFIQAMNNKAASLGLIHTHFTNPTGLEGDGNQYTTASDLLVITRYALIHFPLFRIVAGTFDHTIDATPSHKAYFLENETNLLTSYPGVMGVKTGYTPEAGLCLVTYLNYKGHEVIGVILNSDDRRDDMKMLLDYSLAKEGITPPYHG